MTIHSHESWAGCHRQHEQSPKIELLELTADAKNERMLTGSTPYADNSPNPSW